MSTVTGDATGEAGGGEYFDALIVVGAENKTTGLDGITDVVNEDVYKNLKVKFNVTKYNKYVHMLLQILSVNHPLQWVYKNKSKRKCQMDNEIQKRSRINPSTENSTSNGYSHGTMIRMTRYVQ